jgi:hypothetical protein
MSLPESENTQIDRPIEDSGIHVRDTERASITTWQVFITSLLVIAILCVFFYGLTEQRVEVAGAPQQQSNIAAPVAQNGQKPAAGPANVGAPPTTTGAAAAK